MADTTFPELAALADLLEVAHPTNVITKHIREAITTCDALQEIVDDGAKENARQAKMLMMVEASEMARMEHIAELQDEAKDLRRFSSYDENLVRLGGECYRYIGTRDAGEVRDWIIAARSQLSAMQERSKPICIGVWAVMFKGGVLVDETARGALMIYGSDYEAKACLPKGASLARVDVLTASAHPVLRDET